MFSIWANPGNMNVEEPVTKDHVLTHSRDGRMLVLQIHNCLCVDVDGWEDEV